MSGPQATDARSSPRLRSGPAPGRPGDRRRHPLTALDTLRAVRLPGGPAPVIRSRASNATLSWGRREERSLELTAAPTGAPASVPPASPAITRIGHPDRVGRDERPVRDPAAGSGKGVAVAARRGGGAARSVEPPHLHGHRRPAERDAVEDLAPQHGLRLGREVGRERALPPLEAGARGRRPDLGEG
jgi:hypothetical protein